MALSSSTDYTVTRDAIIKRALRIIGELGQGESASTDQLTEGAIALNMVAKSLQAYGLQLWRRSALSVTPVSGQSGYLIGIGQTTNTTAPLKVYDVYYRNTTTETDTPMMRITRQEYDQYANKSQEGTPNLWYYQPPGPPGTGFTDEQRGTLFVLQTPDSTFADENTFIVVGQLPVQDFDASADYPDFPQYYWNALVWALASNLAYEAGVAPARVAQIEKRAEMERLLALSFDQEEGSLYIQPDMHPWTWT